MKWTKIDENPPKKGRYLALCNNQKDNSEWKGVVDVYFNPHIGWKRCECYNKEDVYVLAYISMEEFDQNTSIDL